MSGQNGHPDHKRDISDIGDKMERIMLIQVMPDQPDRSVILCESDIADKRYAVHLCRVWGERHVYVETMTECDEEAKAVQTFTFWAYGI